MPEAKLGDKKCEIKLAPDCEGMAEVEMTVIGFTASSCLPCGKVFQRKFPHKSSSLAIKALIEKAPQ